MINPIAGKGHGIKRWENLRKKLELKDISFEHVHTQRKGHAKDIMPAALEKGYRKFLCIGGDGTFHHMVNGLFRSRISSKDVLFLVASTGTGNDFARNYRMPANEEVIDLIDSGKQHLQDTGLIKYRNEDGTDAESYFHNFAGAGFDAEVVRKNEKLRWLGSYSYMFSLFLSFLFYHNKECSITIGDSEIRDKIYLMLASIGPYCGGGMKLNPKAQTDDGLLDIFIARNIGKIEIVINASKLYNGKISGHPKVYYGQNDSVKLSSTDNLQVEADGELLGYAPVAVSIIPESLKVLVPG